MSGAQRAAPGAVSEQNAVAEPGVAGGPVGSTRADVVAARLSDRPARPTWWGFVSWGGPGLGVLMLIIAAGLGALILTGVTVRGDNAVLDEFIEERTPARTLFMMIPSEVFSPVGSVVISLIVAIGSSLLHRSWRPGAYIASSVIVSALLAQAFKAGFERHRPPELDQLMHESNFSYPSGHATGVSSIVVSSVIVACLYLVHRRWQVLAVIVGAALMVSVCASRLYLGVHWFTDIIGGTLVGTGCALILVVLLRPLAPNSRSLTTRALRGELEHDHA